MIVAWLMLYVTGLVHALTLFGLSARGTGLVLLAPFLLLPALPALKRGSPFLFAGMAPKAAGIVALLSAIFLLRVVGLDYWDTKRWAPALLAMLTGLGSMWVAISRPDRGEKEFDWIYVILWTLAGRLDPLLPLLGAGALACAMAWMGEAGDDVASSGSKPFLAFLLLGIALPRPWWDFDQDPSWALPCAAVALGAGFATILLHRFVSRAPQWVFLVGTVLVAVLYSNPFAVPWGLALGLVWGLAFARVRRPLSLPLTTFPLLLGLVFSFALHANAQILGRAMWLLK